MTGEDADLLCGEWDSDGGNNYTDSGEQYWIDYEVTLYYENGEWQYRQWDAIQEGVIN